VNPLGGDFATAANWRDDSGNPGVPAANDDALILVPGVTVASAGTASVHYLTSTANLNVLGGSLTAAAANMLGTTTLSGGSLIFSGSSTAMTADLMGGTLGGTGPLTVTGSMDWTAGTVSGGLHVAEGATLDVGGVLQETFDNGTITNDGTVTWDGTGGVEFRHNASVVNRGLFQDVANHAATYTGSGGEAASFHNSGTYEKSAGSGVSSLAFTFDNTGTLKVESGTFQVSQISQDFFDTLNGGTWDVSGGATFEIPGTVLSGIQANVTLDGLNSTFTSLAGVDYNDGEFTLTNGASLATGSFFTNYGLLTIGPGSTLNVDDFDQSSTSGNPRLFFQVAGRPGSNQFGKLADGGQTTLSGGTIGVTLRPGADTASGDAYTFLNSTGGISITGTQPSITQDGTGSATVFNVAVGSNTVTATTVTNLTDLKVASVTPPGSAAAPGDAVTFGWTVQNTNATADTAVANWNDSVFVSTSPTFDSSAVLVATIPHTGGLAAGASYSGSYIGPLPGLLPGDYYVFVRTDIDSAVPDAERTNNQDVSGGTFTVDDLPVSQVLTLGNGASGSVAAGGDVWYRVDAPGGTPLRLAATFAAAGLGELSVDYRQYPTASTSLGSATDPTVSKQVVGLSATQPGTYFVRVHGTGGGSFTLLADTPAIAITRLAHTTGSNLGNATLTVHGVGFTPKTTVVLVKGTITRAATIQYVSSDALYATFSLKSLAMGSYDLKVTDGTRTDTATGGFTVNTAALGSLEYHINQPASTPIGQDVVATIDFRNPGGTDALAPLLLASDQTFQAYVRLAEDPPPGQYDYAGEPLYFLPTSTDAPAGIVPAGYQGSVQVILRRSFGTDPITLKLEEVNSGKSIDWKHLYYDLQPPSMKADAFAGVFASFVATVGSNTNTYFAALRNAATYLAIAGTPTGNAALLDSFLIQNANNPLPGNTLCQVTDLSFAKASLPLDFTRGFLQSIEGRYRLGRLGLGWVDQWDVSLTDGYGNTIDPQFVPTSVLLHSGGTYREFDATDSTKTTYVPIEGGDDVITFDGTRFVLTGANGAGVAFRTDGQLDYIQDTIGTRVTAAYDGNNKLKTLTRSDGKALAFTWNAAGFIDSVTDPNGQVVHFTYSGKHLISATGPNGVVKYTYAGGSAAKKNALTSITGIDKVKITFTYDSHGRLTARSLPGKANPTTYAYGAGGGVTINDGNGSVTLWPDLNGKIGTILESAGPGARITYNANALMGRIETAAGQVWTLTRDANGRVTANTDPLGHTVHYIYDGEEDDPATLTDARGNTTAFTRDFAGNITAITQPSPAGTESYVYDPVGNLVETVNRRGNGIMYMKGPDGRVTSRVYADGSHTDYAYDAHGNMTSATDFDALNVATGTTSLVYTTNDLLQKITYPDGKFLQFTYDVAGRRTSSVDQDQFTTKYVYDKAGRLSQLQDVNGKFITKYTYDKAGRIARKDDANGTFVTYAYDSSGRVLSVVNYKSKGVVNSRLDYTYDVAGRVATMTADGVTTTYGYDLMGELTSVTTPTRTITYTYDAAGNRASMTDNGVTTVYSVNALNEVDSETTGTDVTNFSYDLDGNRTSMTHGTDTTSYTWDDLNRLTGMTSPTDTFAYTYDPLGYLFTTTQNGQTTTNLTDPFGLGWVAAQYNSGGLIAHYIAGLGLEARVAADGSKTFFDFDSIGNVVGLTDSTGAYVNKYSYLPFGETTTLLSGVSNPFTFVGRMGISTDGSGLFNMRTRRYDAATGGFVSDDPLGLFGGDLNIRRYGGNSPTNVIDPLGLRGFDGTSEFWGLSGGYLVSGTLGISLDWDSCSWFYTVGVGGTTGGLAVHTIANGGVDNGTVIDTHITAGYPLVGVTQHATADFGTNKASFPQSLDTGLEVPGAGVDIIGYIYGGEIPDCWDEKLKDKLKNRKPHPDFKFASPPYKVPGTKAVKLY
jgi:RHS repeat-associated protein